MNQFLSRITSRIWFCAELWSFAEYISSGSRQLWCFADEVYVSTEFDSNLNSAIRRYSANFSFWLVSAKKDLTKERNSAVPHVRLKIITRQSMTHGPHGRAGDRDLTAVHVCPISAKGNSATIFHFLFLEWPGSRLSQAPREKQLAKCLWSVSKIKLKFCTLWVGLLFFKINLFSGRLKWKNALGLEITCSELRRE